METKRDFLPLHFLYFSPCPLISSQLLAFVASVPKILTYAFLGNNSGSKEPARKPYNWCRHDVSHSFNVFRFPFVTELVDKERWGRTPPKEQILPEVTLGRFCQFYESKMVTFDCRKLLVRNSQKPR